MKFEIDEATKKRWDTQLHTICSFCSKKYTFNEFIKSKAVWIDENKKQYGKKTICTCGVDLGKRWQITSKVDNYYIITVHLPIAHSGVEVQDWFDYNFWYETMFWQEQSNKQKYGDFQMRYHTRGEAINGHKFVVENLNKIIEHPERFPQGVISVFVNSMEAAENQRKNMDPHVKRNLT